MLPKSNAKSDGKWAESQQADWETEHHLMMGMNNTAACRDDSHTLEQVWWGRP